MDKITTAEIAVYIKIRTHIFSRRLIKKGVNAKTEVLLGKPAEAITSYAEKNGIDLIIMSSHGRSGISRWASGSVAERVFRSACVPVLMVRAPGCSPKVT